MDWTGSLHAERASRNILQKTKLPHCLISSIFNRCARNALKNSPMKLYLGPSKTPRFFAAHQHEVLSRLLDYIRANQTSILANEQIRAAPERSQAKLSALAACLHVGSRQRVSPSSSFSALPPLHTHCLAARFDGRPLSAPAFPACFRPGSG